MQFNPRISKLQVILIVLGSLMATISIFATWMTMMISDGSEVVVKGTKIISEADYYLFYFETFGTIYSPLLPLILILIAVTCQIFSVKYAPTLAASLALGTVLADIIKFMRIDCAICNITEVVPGPGAYLALIGSLAVVIATLIEKNVDDEDEKTDDLEIDEYDDDDDDLIEDEDFEELDE